MYYFFLLVSCNFFWVEIIKSVALRFHFCWCSEVFVACCPINYKWTFDGVLCEVWCPLFRCSTCVIYISFLISYFSYIYFRNLFHSILVSCSGSRIERLRWHIWCFLESRFNDAICLFFFGIATCPGLLFNHFIKNNISYNEW